MSATATMPVLFVGHGSPMNAIEDNAFRRGWAAAAQRMPRPTAVLCVSAHWETRGAGLTASARPETIHDFGGFPPELFAVRYPAPGDPALARRAAELLRHVDAGVDPERGLDHGAWSVLCGMYPQADVPVVQLGLDTRRPPRFHYELARALLPLRREGVLVLGSGNIVHNLRVIDPGRAGGFDWAERFDAEVGRRILAGDHDALVDYAALGPDAALAVPTPEHYLPLLYALALREPGDRVTLFNHATVFGSASMTCVEIAPA